MPAPIDHAPPRIRIASHSLRNPTLLLLFLTALAFTICISIEILNAQAGYILPRELPASGNAKWRTGADTLLREVVSTLGLLQYPLTLLLLISLPIAFLKQTKPSPWRTPLATAFLLTLLCTTLMLYRGYFTSLGW